MSNLYAREPAQVRIPANGVRSYRSCARLRQLPPGTIVVHGGARGADTIAGDVARQLGFIVRVYKADWKTHGIRAGLERNGKMLVKEHREDEPIDIVFAFALDFGPGSGTYDMARRAENVGIDVRRISR
jgi:hypothetical protein